MPVKIESREYRKIDATLMETRKQDDGAMIVEGYATTFNQPYELWRDIKAAVDAVVDNRSLQDMIDNYTRKNGDREEVVKEENCACSI